MVFLISFICKCCGEFADKNVWKILDYLVKLWRKKLARCINNCRFELLPTKLLVVEIGQRYWRPTFKLQREIRGRKIDQSFRSNLLWIDPLWLVTATIALYWQARKRMSN